MSEGDRGSTHRGQDTLMQQIEQTRQELARTVDAIADRISPASNARRATERLRRRAADLEAALRRRTADLTERAGPQAADLRARVAQRVEPWQKRLGPVDPRALGVGALAVVGLAVFVAWRRHRAGR